MVGNSNYYKAANSLKKKCETIIKAVDNISNSIKNNEFGIIPTYEGQLASAGRGLPDMVNRLISYAGNDPAQIMDQYAAEPCSISLNERVVNVRFGSLIPHREKRGVESYASSIPYIRAFYKAAEDLQGMHYDTPVVLVFLHHYAAEEEMVDHDNLLYKPFIDAISVLLLKNDSPRQCSHFMGHMMDNCSFTEIYVIPENMFPIFLQKKLKF